MDSSISQIVKSSLSVSKSIWQRKDGSRWMNDRGFIEPYQKFGRIPRHTPDDPDFPEKGVGGGERKEQVWVSNPFSNKEELIHYFQENSQEAKFLFSIHSTDLPSLSEYKKVWNEEFGNGSINTPLGTVKLGENQPMKNYTKNDQRYRYIGLIKPTLESPNFILKKEIMEKRDKERDYTLHFVKGFKKDGKLIQYFTTTIQKSGKEIMISSFPRSIRQIYKLMNAGKVLFYAEPQPSKSPELHVQNPALKGDSSSVNDIIKGNFVNDEVAPGRTPHERIKMKPFPLPTSETAPTIRTTETTLGSQRSELNRLDEPGNSSRPPLQSSLASETRLQNNKLYQWAKNASKKQDNEMDNNQNISKGFFGFGKKPSPGASRGGGSPPRQGLVKKQIIDSRGRRQTKWVRPQDIQTPIERKREEAKTQRKKITHLNHSEEDKKLIEEITKRHKEFENKAKEQRRIFGSGPQLPKPGLIMRVYARGKVNVGGMLAEVQRIAEDGKSVIAMLTSGKTYEFPLEQLHFAKSLLHYEVGKRGGLIIGRDKNGKPIYGDPEINKKYNEILFEGTERISQAVGYEVSKISLNANHIMKKHPEYFKHPEQAKKLVQYVLNNPTHFLPATKTNYTMVISEKNNKVAVIELKPASKTGKSVVRSAFIFGKDQLKVKLEKERERQVGSQFPQVLGESIRKSNGITVKVLDGLTSHRSDTLRILSNAFLKNQLKKMGSI